MTYNEKQKLLRLLLGVGALTSIAALTTSCSLGNKQDGFLGREMNYVKIEKVLTDYAYKADIEREINEQNAEVEKQRTAAETSMYFAHPGKFSMMPAPQARWGGWNYTTMKQQGNGAPSMEQGNILKDFYKGIGQFGSKIQEAMEPKQGKWEEK